MPQLSIEQLAFRPASEKPTAYLNECDVLVLNPCDGYHVGEIRVCEEDGEIYHVGIYTFSRYEMTPHDFYVT